MMNKLTGIIAAGLLFAGSIAAHAGTIDFSGVQGSNPSPLVLPEATITNLTGSVVLVGPSAASQSDGFCFLGSGCAESGELLFSSAVQNLFFDIDGWQNGDFVAISAFNDASLLGSINAVGNGNLDFSGFGVLTRLVFDDSSTAAGVGYSTFQYDIASEAPVPVPATLALFGLGLAGLAWSRRKTA